MSAVAAAPTERTEWSGEDLTAAAVAERLMRMNRDHARHAHGHAATRTLNLLVAPGADVSHTALAARLEGLRTRHPSRTIVLHRHTPQRLDATLAIDCSVCAGPRSSGSCHDAVELYADEPRLCHADSLVRPLLVGGLPIVLWLPGAQESVAERPLARTAAAIVLDSGAAPAVRDALARAQRLSGDAELRDLAWLRLTRWRQRVATRFDAPAARTLLSRAERLELRFAGDDAATPLLLAGWIAARAGWTLARLEGSGASWEGSARRPDGTNVALALGAPASAGDCAGIHELTLHTADDALRIVEPVAGPDQARAFAAALRTFDEPASGYAPALAALADGMGFA